MEEVGMTRMDHLIEVVSVYAKYLVNEYATMDENLATLIISDKILLNHVNSDVFKEYEEDKGALVEDVGSAIRLLAERNEVIARRPKSKDRIISPYVDGTDKFVVGTWNMYTKTIQTPPVPATIGYQDPAWLAPINFKSI